MKNNTKRTLSIVKWLDFILFANISGEDYEKISDEMLKNNLSILRVMTIISSFIHLLCFCFGLFVPNMKTKLLTYALGLICSAVLCIISFTTKNKKVIKICITVFEMLLLTAGLALTLINAPKQLTITLIPLALITPVLFDDKPYRSLFLIMLTDLVYLIFAPLIKPADILILDTVDVIAFSVCGIIIGSYMTKTKVERYLYAYIANQKSITDGLTDCLNRRAFNNDLIDISNRSDNEEICMISIDVNGLKTVNDTIGHKAGDELIQTVAEILSKTFAESGKCYRIGGDEFAIITKSTVSLAGALIGVAKERLQSNVGNYINSITISAGIASTKDYPEYPLEKLLRIADKKMYHNKNEFYEKMRQSD